MTVAALMIWDSRHGTLADWWPGNQHPHRLAATAARLERHGWTALPPLTRPRHSVALVGYLLIGPGGVFVVDHHVWSPSPTSPASSTTATRYSPATRSSS